jgi:hypothetical protein
VRELMADQHAKAFNQNFSGKRTVPTKAVAASTMPAEQGLAAWWALVSV